MDSVRNSCDVFKQLPPGHLQPQKIHFNFFKFKYQENKFEVVMDVLVEELVDKEVAKVVEQVNRKFTSVGQQKLSWRWSWMWCWMRLTRR